MIEKEVALAGGDATTTLKSLKIVNNDGLGV